MDSFQYLYNKYFYLSFANKFVLEDKPRLLVLLMDDGIEICINDEQSLKASLPIEVTDDGIEICFNDEQ